MFLNKNWKYSVCDNLFKQKNELKEKKKGDRKHVQWKRPADHNLWFPDILGENCQLKKFDTKINIVYENCTRTSQIL